MKRIDDLLAYSFETPTHPLYTQVASHLRASRAFLQFAETYRDKIRKKLRLLNAGENALNLGAELATAYALLQEPRFSLEYEKYTKQRGPDFTVTYRTHTPFNVEVTRIRSTEAGPPAVPDSLALDKFMKVICEKVGQMPSGVMNVLLMVIETPEMTNDDLGQATRRLKQMADQKAETYFRERGFQDAADFLGQYRNLSAIVLHRPVEPPNLLWHNAIARHPLLKDLHPILQRLHNN